MENYIQNYEEAYRILRMEVGRWMLEVYSIENRYSSLYYVPFLMTQHLLKNKF
ncbi:hypothetical protein [Chryseobacterium indoltheticum]|uniref:hypothetical protein n=1 Tax=Chryseobacterium indoltheticum TaxID=254 RepID=UPI003F4972B1